MLCERFTVVQRDHLTPVLGRPQHGDDGFAHTGTTARVLVGEQAVTRLAPDQTDERAAAVLAYLIDALSLVWIDVPVNALVADAHSVFGYRPLIWAGESSERK